MNYFFTIILFVLSFKLLGQDAAYSFKLSEKEVFSFFKEIKKSDKSNLKDTAIRHAVFLANFEKLMNLTMNYGFPNGNYSPKTIKQITTTTTTVFTHILQVYPKQLLNDSIIELFKKEILSGNLDKTYLETALIIFKYDQENGRIPKWDEELKNFFEQAKTEWTIE